MTQVLYFLAFFYLVGCFLHSSEGNECVQTDVKQSVEGKLKKDLLCNYDKNERPVKDHKKAVNVSVTLLLKRISFHAAEYWGSQSITVFSWLLMSWTDEYLTWNSGEYNNLKQIQISSSDVWLPGLTLYNGDSPSSADGRFDSICMLHSSGLIVCIPHLSHSALCRVNVKYWPFDKHNCTMILGSWMHVGEEVNYSLRDKNIKLTDYTPNPSWALISATASRYVMSDCCPNQTYPQLKYTFALSRHSLEQAALTLWPCLIMVCVTLTAALCDYHTMERIILLAVNLVLHLLFIQNTSYTVPKNGNDCPVIILFLRGSLIINGFEIIFTIFLRGIARIKMDTPQWITSTSIIMNTMPVKIIMFNEFDPSSDTSAVIKDEEDLPESPINDRKKQWRRFALFLSRISFIAVFATYIVLLVAFVPE